MQTTLVDMAETLGELLAKVQMQGSHDQIADLPDDTRNTLESLAKRHAADADPELLKAIAEDMSSINVHNGSL
jgi:hypothetical protein